MWIAVSCTYTYYGGHDKRGCHYNRSGVNLFLVLCSRFLLHVVVLVVPGMTTEL